MATFPDVEKAVNDQFTKDIAKDQNVEFNASVNDFVSFALKGKVKGGNIDGTFAPIFKLPDYKVDIKPEITTPDDKGKTVKIEAVATDPFHIKGLKFDFAHTNGSKGGSYFNTAYKNAKFGGVTGKFTFPKNKDNFFTPSIFIETPDTKGFGIGGTTKVVLGEKPGVESWKILSSYKPSSGRFSSYFGFESKLEEQKSDSKVAATVPKVIDSKSPKVVDSKSPKSNKEEAEEEKKEPGNNVYFVGGFLRKFDEDTKLFGLTGSVNISNSDTKLELLFRKNYEDGTFIKIRGDLDGNVGVARQFKPHNVNLILGTNVNVWDGKGNVGFHFATDL